MTASPLDQNPEGNSCSRGKAALPLQVCPKNPRKTEGVQPLGGWRLFGYFLCAQKITKNAPGDPGPPLGAALVGGHLGGGSSDTLPSEELRCPVNEKSPSGF